MARKKCKECLSCFNLVWIEGKRYYHCWLCNTWYDGRDDDLRLVDNPYTGINVPTQIVEEEQTDEGQGPI